MRWPLLLALLTVGCCPPKVVLQRVEVPVAIPCPQPPYLAWPDLPIYHLDRYTSPAEQARAWADSTVILTSTLKQALRLLDGYRVAK